MQFLACCCLQHHPVIVYARALVPLCSVPDRRCLVRVSRIDRRRYSERYLLPLLIGSFDPPVTAAIFVVALNDIIVCLCFSVRCLVLRHEPDCVQHRVAKPGVYQIDINHRPISGQEGDPVPAHQSIPPSAIRADCAAIVSLMRMARVTIVVAAVLVLTIGAADADDGGERRPNTTSPTDAVCGLLQSLLSVCSYRPYSDLRILMHPVGRIWRDLATQQVQDRLDALIDDLLDPGVAFDAFANTVKTILGGDQQTRSPPRLLVDRLRQRLHKHNQVYLSRKLLALVPGHAAAVLGFIKFVARYCGCDTQLDFVFGLCASICIRMCHHTSDSVMMWHNWKPLVSDRHHKKFCRCQFMHDCIDLRIERHDDPADVTLLDAGTGRNALTLGPTIARERDLAAISSGKLEAHFKVGMMLTPDWKSNTPPAKMRILGPYASSTTFWHTFAHLMHAERYDLVTEVLLHRAMAYQLQSTFKVVQAYLACHVAIRRERADIAAAILGLTRIEVEIRAKLLDLEQGYEQDGNQDGFGTQALLILLHQQYDELRHEFPRFGAGDLLRLYMQRNDTKQVSGVELNHTAFEQVLGGPRARPFYLEYDPAV